MTIEKLLVTPRPYRPLRPDRRAGRAARRADRGPASGRQVLDRFEPGRPGRQYGVEGATAFTPDRWLGQGDTVTVGNLTLDVHHRARGTRRGTSSSTMQPSNLAIVGDVLFQGSIGRTDFPKGNHGDLINAITTRLWPLGGQTAFIPRPRPDVDLRRRAADSNAFRLGRRAGGGLADQPASEAAYISRCQVRRDHQRPDAGDDEDEEGARGADHAAGVGGRAGSCRRHGRCGHSTSAMPMMPSVMLGRAV